MPICVRPFATPWTATCQASLSLTISRSSTKFMSIALVMPSSHLILWHSLPFCSQSFPASGTFPLSQLFTSSDQNTGASASASVLPVSFQGWFPLRLTGLISSLSRGLSGVFSSTTVPRHQFFGILLSLWSALTTGRPLFNLASVNSYLKITFSHLEFIFPFFAYL